MQNCPDITVLNTFFCLGGQDHPFWPLVNDCQDGEGGDGSQGGYGGGDGQVGQGFQSGGE